MESRGPQAHFALVLLAAASIVWGISRAAPPDVVANGLRACAAEHDAARRLDCYDHLAKTVTETSPNAVSTEPGASTSPSAVSAEPHAPSSTDRGTAEFGMRGGPLAERQQAHDPRQLAAVVKQIGRRSYGRLLITLDNGQIWLQSEPTEYFPLKVGDSIVIRKAALGSYLLFAPFKRSTRVTRIR